MVLKTSSTILLHLVLFGISSSYSFQLFPKSKLHKTNLFMKYIDGVKDLSEYSTYLLDMWGVMHNGSKPYDGVLDTIKQIRKAGKDIIILSNSSKRTDNAIKTLTKLGFDVNDFEQIITSGEIGFRMLCGDPTLNCSNWEILSDLIEENKKKAFVCGSGDGDEEYVHQAGWTLAPIEEADLIVARGTFTLNDGAGNVVTKRGDEVDYNRMLRVALEKAASRKVPMLVTNPDRVRPDEGLPPMPGAIGDAYENVIGANGTKFVRRIGKLFPEVYELALMNGKDSSKAVMIGDALETDIIGGANAKCAQCWVVNDGIHSYSVNEYSDFKAGTKEVLDVFNNKRGLTLKPTFILKNFS